MELQKDLNSVVTNTSYVYTLRKNAVYGPSDVIQFYIPQTHAWVNNKETFLVFNLQMTGNQYKCAVNEDAGVDSLIRQITVTDGSGATVIETLPNYGYFSAFKRRVESTESSDHLAQLHEGLPNKMTISAEDDSCNQYCDATKSDESHHTIVEVTLPFHLSGLLNPRNKKVTPALALRGIRISIELNSIERAMQAIKGRMYVGKDTGNMRTDDYGGYKENLGYRAHVAMNAGDKTLVLKNLGDSLYKDTTAVLSQEVQKPAHLFCPGQVIGVQVGGNAQDGLVKGATKTEVTVQSISVDGDNRINLELSKSFSEDVLVNASVWVTDDASYFSNNGFKMTSVKMQVGDVIAPPSYTSDVLEKVKRGKFRFDITSYIDVVKGVSADSKNNALVLNATNRRAKSLVVIPEDDANSNNAIENSFRPVQIGDTFQLNNYNLLFGSKLAPDRVVDLTAYNRSLHDPVCLREQLHAIDACSFNVNNIKDTQDNFFIGRRLALKGYSMDLLPNPITVNLNTLKNPQLNVHCFLSHKRQVQCNDNGVAIVY